MRSAVVGLGLGVALVTTACGAGAKPTEGVPGGIVPAGVTRVDPQLPTAELRLLAAAQTDFAVDLYRTVAARDQADVTLGPSSLHTALSMIRAGARGQTAAEIDAVLHTTPLAGRLDELGNGLDRQLRSLSAAEGVEVAIANRVWRDEGQAVLPEYARLLLTHYGAGMDALDIAGNPEAARAAVNAWAAAETGDKVEELFPPDSITAATRLVLANAVHFEADWRFPFPAAATSDQPFSLPNGTTVSVPTMSYDEYLPSGRGVGWTAVRLPYDGEQVSMTVIVPQDLAAFESSLDRALLDRVEASIADGGIHLSLPRFTARTHLSLADTLAGLGMPTAFSSQADFSGMSGAPGLMLGAVEHEAVVEVDETGTQAAAASGGAVLGSHGPTVTVDRPFLFVVRDSATGAVLFLGRVSDPR